MGRMALTLLAMGSDIYIASNGWSDTYIASNGWSDTYIASNG